MKRGELDLYLQDFLSCKDFKDYAPNGLQVEGKIEIGRIATAVTASLEVILQAMAWKADALLVHHGFFWSGEAAAIKGMKRQRIAELLKHELNLFAYHLPLDCHPDLGNNACIAKRLDLKEVSKHKAGNTSDLLWSGKLSQPMQAFEFKTFLKKTFLHEPLHILGHDREIGEIAWCSGAAQDFIEDAKALGVDAFISGEVSERTYYQAKELGIHYYACGHHATERFGIQALGQHLSRTFNLDHQFFDTENPV